jgi:hypothetical protein
MAAETHSPTKQKPLTDRQDELIEELLAILQPQLDGADQVDSAQYRALHSAIAHYTVEVQGQ